MKSGGLFSTLMKVGGLTTQIGSAGESEVRGDWESISLHRLRRHLNRPLWGDSVELFSLSRSAVRAVLPWSGW